MVKSVTSAVTAQAATAKASALVNKILVLSTAMFTFAPVAEPTPDGFTLAMDSDPDENRAEIPDIQSDRSLVYDQNQPAVEPLSLE